MSAREIRPILFINSEIVDPLDRLLKVLLEALINDGETVHHSS